MSEAETGTLAEGDHAQAVREHVAYHEAGHAVVGVLLGHHIEWAAIAPARGLFQGGRVVNQGPALTTTQAVIEHTATYSAGLIAETLSPHQHLLQDESFNRIDDLLGITQAVTTFFPASSAQEQQQLWQAAHDCATDLLAQSEHRAAVRSLAAALLQQGELTHEEVVALMHQAREQESAARLSAWSARENRLWRWFLCSLGVLFVVEIAVIGLLTFVMNVWLLLALTAVSSFLLPLCLWKIAARRFGESGPTTQMQGEAKQHHIWSFADYGVFGMEIAAGSRSRSTSKQQTVSAPIKPARGRYDRHKRLPQRRKRAPIEKELSSSGESSAL